MATLVSMSTYKCAYETNFPRNENVSEKFSSFKCHYHHIAAASSHTRQKFTIAVEREFKVNGECSSNPLSVAYPGETLPDILFSIRSRCKMQFKYLMSHLCCHGMVGASESAAIFPLSAPAMNARPFIRRRFFLSL